MHITHLSLTNFRNFGRLELDLPLGSTLLFGENAQGKTNLLEAIYYLATTRSPHTNHDDELIHWEAGQYGEPVVVGRLVAHVQAQNGMRHLEMRLIREQNGAGHSFRREALVDRRKVRLMDLLGNLRVVLFLPEDVGLITGSPANRRRYLDITLCQSDGTYLRSLSAYNKVLEQRNVLLRQMAERGINASNRDVLDIYTDKLVTLGSQIFTRRAKFFAELARAVQRIHYESLTAGKESLRLGYLPRLSSKETQTMGNGQSLEELAAWLSDNHDQLPIIETKYRQVLDAVLEHDVARGATSIGPHRDDWHFWVDGRSLRSFGSRGQQRSAILALKMGEIQWISAETGDTPLLLLDDVMAELDHARRNLLLDTLGAMSQAVITTADATIFDPTFIAQAHTMSVKQGRIQPEEITV